MSALYFAAPSPIDSSTSTSVTTTSTSVTTTTLAPTTTTSAPTTTSTTHAPTTTTTHATTTTTTAPVAHAKSDSTPWALVIVVAALAVAIIVLIIVLVSRRARARESSWRRAVLPGLSEARLARDALVSGNAASEDETVRAAVALQTERAASSLERVLPGAPEPGDAEAVRSVASSLRGFAFAIEADRLLRHGTSAPTGAQLAAADQARRDSATTLDRAIARLAASIGRGNKHPPR